jgi:hypothetical protein
MRLGFSNDGRTHNLYRLIGEERLVLWVERPAAVLKISNPKDQTSPGRGSGAGAFAYTLQVIETALGGNAELPFEVRWLSLAMPWLQ